MGKAQNLHLRIIQTLNNPAFIFHLKNVEQKCSISFLRRIGFSRGVAFYLCSSKPGGGRAGDGTVEGPQETLGQAGDLAVCRSRLALAPADVCHAAIAVAVARFCTCQEKLEILTF